LQTRFRNHGFSVVNSNVDQTGATNKKVKYGQKQGGFTEQNSISDNMPIHIDSYTNN